MQRVFGKRLPLGKIVAVVMAEMAENFTFLPVVYSCGRFSRILRDWTAGLWEIASLSIRDRRVHTR